jgi:hypothetical protein
MRGLSLTQPWATLVAIGAKQIETQSWSTPYRGWVAIHASKGFPHEASATCHFDPFRTCLLAAGIRLPADLPRGAIVAVANLHRIGRIGQRADGAVTLHGFDLPIVGDELAFGDYTPGRYGWALTGVRPLGEPIPCRGALGLWDVPADVAARIDAQIGVRHA